MERARVRGAEVVADDGPPEHARDPPARAVGDHQPALGDVAVGEHQLAQRVALERRREREIVRRAGDALEHEAAVGELVDVVGLRDAAAHVDGVVEDAPDRGRGVHGQVPPQRGGAAEPAAGEQQRRVDGAGGDHDRGGAHLERAAGGPRQHAARAAVLDEDPLHPRARDELRAGLQRARQVDLAGVLLGARRAPEGAHARAAAAARVAAQVAAGPAEPLGAAADRRRVAPGELRRDLGDAERRLDALEERVREPVDAVLGAPALEHRRRRAEARARVHERRPAGAAPEREHQRRPPDRRDLAAVAVQPRQRVARAARRVRDPARGPLLEHHDPQPALGELRRRDRAAGAAADHADVSAHGPGSAGRRRRRSS